MADLATGHMGIGLLAHGAGILFELTLKGANEGGLGLIADLEGNGR